jgi:hypothetical protein
MEYQYDLKNYIIEWEIKKKNLIIFIMIVRS